MEYNKNGFLTLNSFNSLGFNSISKINNYEACSKYILKYINKDLCKAFKGDRLYFCSKGLNRSKSVCQFYSSEFQPISFDFDNEFVSKKLLNYYNLKKYIDFLNNNYMIYLVIKDELNLIR